MVNHLPIVIDDRLTTVTYWMPYREGWLSDVDDIELSDQITAQNLHQRNAVALVDSVAATTLLDSHVILRDHAVVSRRESMLTLVTSTRPDQIDDATIDVTGVSATGRAVGRAIISEFYGIRIAGWSEEQLPISETMALIKEGVAALQASDDAEHYHEDLGRAWLLLTDTPFVSHVCLVPRQALTEDPQLVHETVTRLDELRRVSRERAREVRRNVAKDFSLDREMVTETLSDQVYELGEEERTGLETLYRRTGALRDVRRLQQSIVSLGQPGS